MDTHHWISAFGEKLNLHRLTPEQLIVELEAERRERIKAEKNFNKEIEAHRKTVNRFLRLQMALVRASREHQSEMIDALFAEARRLEVFSNASKKDLG